MAEQQAQLTFCGIIISVLYHSSCSYPRDNQNACCGLDSRKSRPDTKHPSLDPEPDFQSVVPIPISLQMSKRVSSKSPQAWLDLRHW